MGLKVSMPFLQIVEAPKNADSALLEASLGEDNDSLEIFNEEFSADDRAVALDFVAFLRENELEFVRDRGYWRDKIYFLIQYDQECVCFMAINDPDEKDNRFTVWSDEMHEEYLTEEAVEKNMTEFVDARSGLIIRTETIWLL